MKRIVLLLFVGLITRCYGQETEVPTREPFVRVYLAASLCVGFRTMQASPIQGGPVIGQATLPLRFRHHWFLIPEAYGGAFRSPKFPDKHGLIFASYPRYSHQLYGIRLGRSFALPDNGFSVLPSVGIDYLQTEDPYLGAGGFFGRSIEYNTYRLYSIPFQIDLRFQKKRESYAAFAIGMRYNKNAHRPFGSISVGVELDLNLLVEQNDIVFFGTGERERRRRAQKVRFNGE